MAGTGDRPITRVLGDIVRNVAEIIGAEFRLAKAELKEDASRVRGGGVLFTAGALLACVGVAFVCLSAVYALSLAVPPWAAALIVGVVILGAAGISVVLARRQLRGWGLRRTAATVQENLQWAKTRVE